MGEGVQTVERSPLRISSTCDKEHVYNIFLILLLDVEYISKYGKIKSTSL